MKYDVEIRSDSTSFVTIFFHHVAFWSREHSDSFTNAHQIQFDMLRSPENLKPTKCVTSPLRGVRQTKVNFLPAWHPQCRFEFRPVRCARKFTLHVERLALFKERWPHGCDGYDIIAMTSICRTSSMCIVGEKRSVSPASVKAI